MQSLAGAPRLLAAIAQDNLIPALAPLVPKREKNERPASGFITFENGKCDI